MKLFSYVLAYEDGSAPNPWWGFCTLAICKPGIRRVAEVGNWIMGTGSKSQHTYQKLVYAMRVSEVVALEDYFRDARFKEKKPDLKNKDWRRHQGDNVYKKNADGLWTQLPGPREAANMEKDLRGKHAIISDHFYYFGTNAVELPAGFRKMIHTNQGHRSQFPNELVREFVKRLEGEYECGVHGEPTERIK